jgi:hypothetical protein
MIRAGAAAAVVLAIAACTTAPHKLSKTGLKKSDRAAWRAVLKWSDDCESGFAVRDDGSAGLDFYPLRDRTSLVHVICAPGAYQGSQSYYLLDERTSPPSAKPIEFTTWEAAGPEGKTLERRQTTELTGNAEFTATTQELAVFNRYRGPGDCGSYAVYRIANGKAEVREFRAKLECDGEGAEHPERWPKIDTR